jgi:hypothetical protein
MTVDKAGNDLSTDQVFLIKRGLIGSGWCCAPKHMNLEQVQAAVDEQCEPYLPAMCGESETPWTVAPREHEDKELVSPGLCNENCDRQHWFLIGGISGAFLLAMTEEGSTGFPDDLRIRSSKAEE